MAASETTFEGWAIVELMGHRRLAGYVREVELAGAGMLQLEIPAHEEEASSQGPVTQFYAPGAIYCITPTTEAIARAVGGRPAPVHPWELPRIAAADDPTEVDEHVEAEWEDLDLDREVT
jgi:hypothetical protein